MAYSRGMHSYIPSMHRVCLHLPVCTYGGNVPSSIFFHCVSTRHCHDVLRNIVATSTDGEVVVVSDVVVLVGMLRVVLEIIVDDGLADRRGVVLRRFLRNLTGF